MSLNERERAIEQDRTQSGVWAGEERAFIRQNRLERGMELAVARPLGRNLRKVTQKG